MNIPKIIFRNEYADFVIIDPTFPQKNPFAFRNIEITAYLSRISNAKSYTMYHMVPDAGAWFSHGYGVSEDEYIENKKGYLKHYPKYLSSKIRYLHPHKRYKIKLAYSFFLAETYVLLPFYEKNKVPFIFVLYPGGSFGLNNKASDAMLIKIFSSHYFRGVIVTQKITYDYLIRKKLCEAEKVHLIYGGFVQFEKNDVLRKLKFGENKETLDICFVAAKYSHLGVDKGYDIFIETAKIIANSMPNVHYHVVGGFDENDIDVSSLRGKIHFYGYKDPIFLKSLYSYMDIFYGYNKPNILYDGSFDGFPLGIDASFCGVALFVGDPLKMNIKYKSGIDIVILNGHPAIDAKTISSYLSDSKKLYELSARGQELTQQLFDIATQIEKRLNVFQKYVKLNKIDRRK